MHEQENYSKEIVTEAIENCFRFCKKIIPRKMMQKANESNAWLQDKEELELLRPATIATGTTSCSYAWRSSWRDVVLPVAGRARLGSSCPSASSRADRRRGAAGGVLPLLIEMGRSWGPAEPGARRRTGARRGGFWSTAAAWSAARCCGGAGDRPGAGAVLRRGWRCVWFKRIRRNGTLGALFGHEPIQRWTC